MRKSAPSCNADNDLLSTLLAPLTVGKFQLSHRVVLAPVTRCRALNYVPQRAHVEYYSQRATEGGLLITEAVAVAQEGVGFPHSPGIWSEEQVEAWKAVVQAVHDKGGIIFCQLWHVGRASHTYYQPEGYRPVSSTSRKVEGLSIRLPDGIMAGYSEPRSLKTEEIPVMVNLFRQAAKNARRAGFDGVEIHAAHGYLVDQFFKDGINDRTDEYGGSIENRCKFGLQVVSAVAEEMGSNCTAIRISPVIDHLGATESDPEALGLHIIGKLNKLNLAYLHLTEPRYTNQGVKETAENCLVFSKAFEGVVMSSGGYTKESGMEAIKQGAADLISFGRLFISNPDLPLRFAIGAKLNPYERATFYTHDQVKGYLDYPKLSPRQVEQGWARKALRRRLDMPSSPKCGMPSSPKCGVPVGFLSPTASPVLACSSRFA